MGKHKKKSALVGRKIVEIRRMPAALAAALDWHVTPYRPAPVMLLLDDGTYLYAAQDEEQNGPGCLYGIGPDGMGFIVLTGEEDDDGEAT